MAHAARTQLEDVGEPFPLPYAGLQPRKVLRNLPAAALYELVRGVSVWA
jgi:hypothetical protein